MIDGLVKRLKQNDIALEVSDQALEYLARRV
jgi:hypothetical protein